MALTFHTLSQWLDQYFTAWQSNDPTAVAALFADEATYSYGPFTPPTRGRSRIVAAWVADPHQQVAVHTAYTPLAINGNLGVAHWQASYRVRTDTARRIDMDGILVLRFDAALRCVAHREWYVQREQVDR